MTWKFMTIMTITIGAMEITFRYQARSLTLTSEAEIFPAFPRPSLRGSSIDDKILLNTKLFTSLRE